MDTHCAMPRHWSRRWLTSPAEVEAETLGDTVSDAHALGDSLKDTVGEVAP